MNQGSFFFVQATIRCEFVMLVLSLLELRSHRFGKIRVHRYVSLEKSLTDVCTKSPQDIVQF
jgi:hypothetical protein